MDINILGFGVMGKQISAIFYLLGYNVSIYSRHEKQEEEFLKQVDRIKRKIEPIQEGNYHFFNDIMHLSNNLTIECVEENIESKKDIYQKFRSKNLGLYFSNTSSYSPKEIADDVNGLHFFNPITLGFVELYVVDGLNEKSKEQISCIIQDLEKIKFDVIKVSDNRGYIGNYILFHEIATALKLVEKFNYSIEDINKIYSKLYNGRDIFIIIDLVGIDVVNQIIRNLHEEDNSLYLPKILEIAIKSNILGRKNKTSIKDIINGI